MDPGKAVAEYAIGHPFFWFHTETSGGGAQDDSHDADREAEFEGEETGKENDGPHDQGDDVRFHANLLRLRFVGVISLQKSGSGELHHLNEEVIYPLACSCVKRKNA